MRYSTRCLRLSFAAALISQQRDLAMQEGDRTVSAMHAWDVEEVCAWVLQDVARQGEAIAAVLKAEEISGEVLFS